LRLPPACRGGAPGRARASTVIVFSPRQLDNSEAGSANFNRLIAAGAVIAGAAVAIVTILTAHHSTGWYTPRIMTHSGIVGLFPGTFDPITNGHLDVIRRGRTLFDRLIIAIAHNPAKVSLFSIEQRKRMICELVADVGDNVSVETYDGLTVDFARNIGATAILRGLRNMTDLNYEFQIALTNRAIADIETVFIMTGETYAFTSSTLIKQIASATDIHRLHRLLPPIVVEALEEKKRQNNGKIPWQHADGHKD
jgi:pantetheine-phosphate adenylyltransferase